MLFISTHDSVNFQKRKWQQRQVNRKDGPTRCISFGKHHGQKLAACNHQKGVERQINYRELPDRVREQDDDLARLPLFLEIADAWQYHLANRIAQDTDERQLGHADRVDREGGSAETI